ncbi:MAG TPA: ABC transporter ATP-binding protein [Puia sp.]|nr:ABC transporter ATP-binding protein [Puia sp.]
MNYNLDDLTAHQQRASTLTILGKLLLLIKDERRNLILALLAILTNSAMNLLNPYIIGRTIDKYIMHKDYHGVLINTGLLIIMALIAFAASYTQTRMMGGVGQRMLFKLRNAVFNKLQELPVAFFNQNKAGDLISRINNDTDKINQFFSQSLMQFIGTMMTMIGAGIFLLAINFRLGVATLVPGLLILIFTKSTSKWVKKKNADSMKTTGGLSSEIQESLNNFKVIIAFNRRDYFRKRFEESNEKNYVAAKAAGISNSAFTPVYGFFASTGQLIVLTVGIYLISTGRFSIGLLVSYLAYSTNFYNPLRQLAVLWTNFQVAMAGSDRISHILNMESNLPVLPDIRQEKTNALLEFRNVHFGYEKGEEILHNINFALEPGKTYALVGPTGGGKTTTASLLARLYDPVSGTVLLDGKDIRSYELGERTRKIGFILQEPFLFTGTVRDNILYGNENLTDFSNEQLEEVIRNANLQRLLEIFENGLDTKVSSGGESISLGQKQLIAFMRAVLRNPDLLILDEATANIDTITEKILEDILNKLPQQTTRVIIAHRLNTIQNADEIYFVNAGEVIRAGSFDHAVKMLLQEKRAS